MIIRAWLSTTLKLTLINVLKKLHVSSQSLFLSLFIYLIRFFLIRNKICSYCTWQQPANWIVKLRFLQVDIVVQWRYWVWWAWMISFFFISLDWFMLYFSFSTGIRFACLAGFAQTKLSFQFSCQACFSIFFYWNGIVVMHTIILLHGFYCNMCFFGCWIFSKQSHLSLSHNFQIKRKI